MDSLIAPLFTVLIEKKVDIPEVKPTPIVIERVVREPSVPEVATIAPQGATGGSGGYIMAGFNCVQCANQLTGRAQNGNAGNHVPSSSTPWIGAIMIFYPGEQGAGFAGHVGVVVGINNDGSVNLAHCNWSSGETTFASTGKFY